MPLVFRPDIDFDPRNDDAVIWGDDGDKHLKLIVRRQLLVTKYGLQRHFDKVGARTIMENQRGVFEKVAQDAYNIGASEVIIG
jgi:hypothetical protein